MSRSRSSSRKREESSNSSDRSRSSSVKRDAIQLRKSPTFTRKITKVADFEKKIDKNTEKTVTKSAEKRKIQVSSPVEIKKKVKKTNIIKTITNEPEGKFQIITIWKS